MKATLEFNLPEEKEEYETCYHGTKWSLVVWNLDQELRKRTKYAPDNTPEEVVEELQEIRDFLWGLLEEEGLEM